MTWDNAGQAPLRVSGKTQILGVFGHPVTHTLSPAMHNAALTALGLPYIYVAFPVAPEALGTALRALPALGIVGVNLTIPHKERALPLMDEITREARDVGAVNTVHCVDGRLLGDNTDGFGFYEPLRELYGEIRGQRAVVLGAGGAARSVAFRLAREGARICLVNRTPERALRLVRALADAGLENCGLQVLALEDRAGLAQALQTADLLVNTTRIGMVPEHKDPPPVPPEMLHKELLVYDLVYNPIRTELLKAAELCGCRTLNGVKMLVCQGAAAFQRWTGCWPSTEVMEAAVVQGLTAC